MEQTTFTKRNNAKRAAERMIEKGTAPSIDYKLHEREDGRFEIVWKASEAATEELHQLYERGRKAGLTGKELAERLGTAESTFFRWVSGKNKIRLHNFRRLEEIVSEAEQGQGAAAVATEQIEQEIIGATETAHEHPGAAEDNGFGPDPWPPGARVQVAIGKRRIRMGTVDYQIDSQYWRVVLDGAAGGVSGMYRGDQLSAPGADTPGAAPRARAKKERAAGAAPKRTSKTAELDAAAARGVMPEKPICTSLANKDQYQKRFDFLAERAAAGDWDAVRNYEVKGVNSYAKMVKQYRDRLLAAHAASTTGSSEAA
jgi:transcriptional regulator with XRE-family HTH domain